MARAERARLQVIPLLAGALGAALILAATSRYGVGLSADSVTYLAAAESLAAGRGYLMFDGGPLLVFPPLLSAILAALSLAGIDPLVASRALNSLCFGLIALLSTRWLANRTGSLGLTLAGAAAVLLSPPLIEISVYAWSEPLFALFTLLLLLQLQRPADDGSLRLPALAGLCAALACLTRYAGITLILVGALVLAYRYRASALRAARQVLVFAVIAAAPLALWLLRNYQISSTLTGDRAPSKVPTLEAVRQAATVVSLWVLPSSLPDWLRLALLGAAAVALCGLIALLAARRGSPWVFLADEAAGAAPLLLFAGIYTAFMVVSTATTALSPIDNRYMSPVFAPLVCAVLALLDAALKAYGPRLRAGALAAGVAVAIGGWLVYPAYTATRSVWSSVSHGAGGFHVDSWVSSELVAHLRGSPPGGAVYSNEPYAVYALTGQVYAESPRKVAYESLRETGDLARLERRLRAGVPVYLVWFDTEWWEGYLYAADELAARYDLTPVAKKRDGAIYLVRLRE